MGGLRDYLFEGDYDHSVWIVYTGVALLVCLVCLTFLCIGILCGQ